MKEEEVVVNERREVSEHGGAENGGDDHGKIKGEHCNGVTNGKENEEEVVAVNGDVGGKIHGDSAGEFVGGSHAVAAGGDSGVSDLVAVVDGNGGGAGAASEGLQKVEHKVNRDGEGVGESQVTVSDAAVEAECECDMVNNKESDCTDASASAVSNGSAEEEEIREKEISNVAILVDADVGGENVVRENESVAVEECADDQNGSRSVEEGVVDVNKIHDHEPETVVVGGEDVENGGAVRELSECAAENGIHGEVNGVSVSDDNKIQDQKFEREVDVADVQRGVENEIRDDGNGAQGFENIAGAAEASGDQKDVVEGVADLNKSHSEFESVADQNGLAVESEVSEIPVVVDGVSATVVEDCAADKGDQYSSGEKALVECVDSGGGDEKDGGTVDQERSESVSDADVDKSLESENIVRANVLSEKDIVTKENQDEEFKSVVGEDVQKGFSDTQLSECTEKNSICVDVDVDSTRTDVKECANVDAPNSLEKAQFESVADTDADKSIVDADIQNGVTEPEPSECADKEVPVEGDTGSKLERSKELGHELVSDLNDNAVVSEGEPSVDISGMNDDAVESGEPSALEREVEPSAMEREAEPSALEREVEPSALEREAEPSALKREAEPSALEGEAEPSVVETEAEPSALEGEAEPSVVETEAEPSADTSDMKNIALESEAETSAVEREAEPSAVESEAEPSADMSDMKSIAVGREAKTSNNAMENEGEPSVEGELSLEGDGSKHGDEDSRPALEGSTTDTLDGQHVGSEVVRRPFYYLIRLPRYDDDENMKEQIKIALHQVEEKTKIRDEIRVETQARKASCKECSQEVRAALSEERAARDLLKSKRQEMDSVQSTMNRLNNAISVGDIDDKIKNMEHMIQHETLPLKEEKQLIRQIKQLKQNREELSSNMGKQDQSQQSVDNTDSIEEHSKRLQLLKKEVESLRNNVLKTEAATKAARKKYDDESNKLSELLARFKAADDIRQEAYAKLQALRKQLHEKNKYFWEYKNAAKKGQELAAEGKKEELQCFCVDQVERIMDLWNKNDEFRRDYIRCNTRSTLRRLQTLDGRSLGPDEEPPVIPNFLTERATKNNSVISQSSPEHEKKSTSTESVDIKDEPVSKAVVQRTEKNQTTTAKMPAKPAPSNQSLAAVPRWGDEPEDTIEEPVRTKEEEELILKAEKARKEEEAAKLKEKRRLEEIEKAKEAMQRKKRNAEKAEQRAALKAQKEAEQKEKEREKRARKKERRKAASTDPVENTEQEPAPSSETLTRSTEEIDQSEKPVEVTKRPQKPSQFTRQTKSKSVPLPLRNRGRRRIQPWMWVLIAVLVVVALFYLGNSSSLRSWLQDSGF